MAEAVQDRWAAWLLRRRHGDDPDGLKQTLERLAPVRDHVLANGAIAPGETLLNVGCGDGLIAFGALDRVGKLGTVIFSDISSDLLEHDRRLIEQLGLVDRCRFVQAAADDLSAIADGSVDVVTTRSVLAYVKRKREAIAEFARVLRPGGRISLYEPVNRHIYAEPTGSFFGYDIGAVEDLASRVNAAYEARQSLADDPMFDYDERDLLGYVEDAGFRAASRAADACRAGRSVKLGANGEERSQSAGSDADGGNGGDALNGGTGVFHRAPASTGRGWRRRERVGCGVSLGDPMTLTSRDRPTDRLAEPVRRSPGKEEGNAR
jgi:ubiquinone/menaquinone biosynthesis C-methylase UbiE